MLQTKDLFEIIDKKISSLDWEKEPNQLYQPLKYMLDLGGKRLRPRFCLAVYNLFKENIDDSIIYPALAVEVFHNFTLIHDDIMDNADIRRGKAVVHKKWNENAAILSGDAMCIYSYKLLGYAPKDKSSDILNLFSQTALEVCEGQQYDMDFENRQEVTMDEYLKMIGLKTAVLIACSAKMGAILADAPKKICDQIYQFGYQLGIAFQIQDDYLDSFGDQILFGKKIGGDILNNKKTWLLIKCLNSISDNDKQKLHSLLSLDSSPQANKIEKVRNFFIDHNIKSLAEEAVNEYYNKALKTLSQINLTDTQRENIVKYSLTLLNRDK